MEESDFGYFSHRFLEDYQIERFWSKVDKSPGQGPKGECWEWQGGFKTNGEYGGFYVKQINNTVTCHKLAFLIIHNFNLGDIPNGVVVRHSCNNPPCVRPIHLLLGTCKDNSNDMILAGNSLKADKNPRAILSWEIVNKIRKLWNEEYLTNKQLFDIFNIRRSVIWQIVYNKTWCDQNYFSKR